MDEFNNYIQEYKIQLSKGCIQKVYKGIMTFMSDLKICLEGKHPDYSASSLYFGYMDMTYFAFTPSSLKEKKLKIAIVFLHEDCKFELWLAGNNRQIQAEYIELLKRKDIGKYTLTQISPGVDSIIEAIIVEHPDFDNLEHLKMQIETKALEFIKDIVSILS